jgi:hypothetical protein
MLKSYILTRYPTIGFTNCNISYINKSNVLITQCYLIIHMTSMEKVKTKLNLIFFKKNMKKLME